MDNNIKLDIPYMYCGDDKCLCLACGNEYFWDNCSCNSISIECKDNSEVLPNTSIKKIFIGCVAHQKYDVYHITIEIFNKFFKSESLTLPDDIHNLLISQSMINDSLKIKKRIRNLLKPLSTK